MQDRVEVRESNMSEGESYRRLSTGTARTESSRRKTHARTSIDTTAPQELQNMIKGKKRMAIKRSRLPH